MKALENDRSDVQGRLRNWGKAIRYGYPDLSAKNGLWISGRKESTYDPDDAQIVEHAITSLTQPRTAREWRRTAFLLKVHYVDRGTARQKAQDYSKRWHTSVCVRTYYYRLASAEVFLDGMLPNS